MRKLIFFLLLLVFVGCGNDETSNIKVPEDKNEPSKIATISYKFDITDKTSVKLQGDVYLYYGIDNLIPTVEEMKSVALELIQNHPSFENYFFYFHFQFSNLNEQGKDYNLYYRISKLGKEDFQITPLYEEIPMFNITFEDIVVGCGGIFPFYSVAPIKIGDSFDILKEKIGNPAVTKNNKVEYYLVNDKYQMFGVLALTLTENIVSDINFYSLNLHLKKSQIEDIKSYITGTKKYEELKIKELEDIF
ncbi:putative lipoprotein [Fusobacterium necrophorum subsp. funduliforme Fnf 1007]|uniref:Lipoprotein n=2 Tax=Fusobacterium necrophorum TaxID=859 RepID=A0AAN3VVR9_9FUSO|nr:putative lipoprotein [Fusobacterium necrophorum subsp. funduliforme Fnf 1007]